MAKILCICLSSTIQRTVNFKEVKLTEVNRSTSYRMDASGKALNSARVLSQLDKNCVTAFCPVGEKNKELFLELAERDNLNINYVVIPGYTRECWTLLDNMLATTTELVVGEPDMDFDVASCEQNIIGSIKMILPETDAVLFAGSKPSYFTDNLVPEIAKLSLDSGKIFLADYHGKELLNTLKICTPSIIKINEIEFAQTFEPKAFSNGKVNEEILKTALKEKSRELDNIIIVTRGADSTYAAEKGKFIECEVEKVKPVNTTACGDSFSAGFIYEYMNTKDFNAGIKKGTWCASRNAELETPGAIR